ncbi:glycosyltransferase family 4 protein [Deltaproteobacteria bacterium]|nr:glycosyltransferase family 4 protein [Deltaproteobacteria bacterium]
MKHLQKKTDRRILVDAREFTLGRLTGIGRVIEGLIDALAESPIFDKIILAVLDPNSIPSKLKNRKEIEVRKVPVSFLKSEKTLSDLSGHGISLFFSPYPKLPIFGVHCLTINMVHDVLDLTYPDYKRRFKVFFDSYRLRSALKKADLTWYVSSWSFEETKRYAVFTGKNPRVRYNGIDDRFIPNREDNDLRILEKYRIKPDYILILGNGSPHKNPGVILEIIGQLKRQVIFAGVSTKNQNYWRSRYPGKRAVWISHVKDEDLPSIIRGAYCLAQPSKMEGYGYPPLEAMGCGVPAIVSNIPVLTETTGGAALTAAPDDPKEWTEAFNLLEDSDRYKHHVDIGLEWVRPLIGQNGWQQHIYDIEELMNT